MNNSKLRIGTRGSRLALWQAEHIRTLLAEKGVATEIVKIETRGDKILDVSISKIGSKGVFTEEIEDQLKEGTIDIAVHSAKDMQSTLPEGFELIAFTKREKPNDILLSHKPYINLTKAGLVLGTSSTRRVAFLKKYYPKTEIVPVRGNLQTRIRKMEDGACDALLLAFAGAHRMNYDDMIIHEFGTDQFIPAVGQGSIAIEVHHDLDRAKKELVRSTVNDPQTENALLAERAYLKEMNGGCSIPVFGLASIKGNMVTMEAGIISLDGQNMITSVDSAPVQEAAELGRTMAHYVLENGGRPILDDIKANKEA